MKNWSQLDKMALDAMEFVLDYCDVKEICADCVFHNSEICCCQLKEPFNQLGSFIKEVKSHVN